MRVFIALLFTSLLSADTVTERPAPQAVKLVWPRPAMPPMRFVAAISGDPLRMSKPFGITLDGGDRLFIADPRQRGVLVHDRKPGKTTRWTGNARFPLDGPVGVALAPDGRLFVTDAYRPQVVVFAASGEVVAAFGNDVLKRPQGIALDAARGRLYVGDVRLHQVLSFDTNTLKLQKATGGPSAAGQPELFSMPAHLAVNSKGNLYVADMWNCRIQVFGPDGALVQRFSTECRRVGEYDRPHGIAIDRQDRIYVSNPNDGGVQIFKPDGQPLEFVSCLKPRESQTGYVRAGIAIDREDRIYFAEQRPGDGRVLIFARGRNRNSSPP